FRDRQRERVVVDGFEVRLPPDLATANLTTINAFLGTAAIHLAALEAPKLSPFYEAHFGANWRTAILDVILGLSDAHPGREPRERRLLGGFKLRCGGLEASAFPSAEQVAFTVFQCRNAFSTSVPLKFTAGLHHPIRHFDAQLNTPVHGFLNVFVAGALAGQ